MSAPKRIQLRRTKGWRKPDDAIVVARPSRWGNPYAVILQPNWPRWAGSRPSVVRGPDGAASYPPAGLKDIVGRAAAEEASRVRAAQMAVDMYRELVTNAHMADDFVSALTGHDLACWCPPGPCHADVLLELANPGWQPIAAVSAGGWETGDEL